MEKALTLVTSLAMRQKDGVSSLATTDDGDGAERARGWHGTTPSGRVPLDWMRTA